MRKRIVVIDDDPGLQDIFKIILERAGYEVEILTNVGCIQKNQYKLPDLFVLDKQLSGFDGLNICRFLKQQKSTSQIPVIMISANPGIKALSAKAGADDAIEKPFEISYLLQMIRKYININDQPAVRIDE